MAPQPVHSQQSNWSRSSSQKSSSLSSQMNQKGDKNSSWNHPSQQTHHFHQQNQQFFNQQQFNSNPNQFTYDSGFQANNPQYSSGQQMNYADSNEAASDPWNWGWDDTSNNEPGGSFSGNNNVSNDSFSNWNTVETVQDQSSSFNPVQNYFQKESNLAGSKQDGTFDPNDQYTKEVSNQPFAQHMGQNMYENNEKLCTGIEESNERLEMKLEGGTNENESLENVPDMSFHAGEGDANFDIKSESAQSFHSSSLSNTSEFKTERLSPDPSKIPLTTQALRDFCKEKYENGPLDLKSRSNADGLTPQWSVESQMSMSTVSDDISSFAQEGSHSDLSGWESTPRHYQSNDMSLEGSFNTSPRPGQIIDSVSHKQAILPLNQNFEASEGEVKRNDESLATEDRLNQQIIHGSGPPSTAPPRKAGDTSGKNPFSLNQKLLKKGALGKSTSNKGVENLKENEFGNLAKQMDSCSLSSNPNQQIISGSSIGVETSTPNLGVYRLDNELVKRGDSVDEVLNQETIPDNEERPDAEERGTGMTDSSVRFQSVSLSLFQTSLCLL